MSAFDTSIGHPHCESVRIVVTSVVPLGSRSTSEFVTPNDQRIVHESSPFQACEEPGNRAIDFRCIFGVPVIKIRMLIPLDFAVAVGDLHESHSSFQKSSGHQALPTKIFSDCVVDSVQLLSGG